LRRPAAWRPAVFFFGCGLSIALLVSWFLEPTRSLWLAIDEKVFWTLNRSLAAGNAWQVIWAAVNNRAADVVMALTMIGLFAHFALRKGRNEINATIAVFLMLSGLAIVGVQIGKAVSVDRWSPTLLHPDALRLSELVSWLPTKDNSGDSFPGDHATALLIWAGIVTAYLPRAYAAAAWVLAILFMTPRVVGGAHWLTDDLVGSVAIAGFVLSCVFATPLHSILTERLERMVRRLRAHRKK
jgi:membrane-associated phospholipid phosphatase